MFVFSTKKATETGNLEVNSSQFRKLTSARNASAEPQLTLLPAQNGVAMPKMLLS